jgi:excisionase family DNA binding protein
MASLSLREAAQQTRVTKSTIWRAIKSGRMSAARADDGGFAIDPAEPFRAFPPQRSEQRPARQDATASEVALERPATPAKDELAVKLAVAEAEIAGLKALLTEVKANRDELRQDRDDWRGRAERLLAPPERRAWWRRLVG